VPTISHASDLRALANGDQAIAGQDGESQALSSCRAEWWAYRTSADYGPRLPETQGSDGASSKPAAAANAVVL